MPNVKSSVNKHNKKVLKNENEGLNNNEPARTCNCPRDTECPFDNRCLEKDVQYQATVTSNLPDYGTKVYKGICSTTWKDRFGNHKKSFNHEKYKTETALSREIWRIKEAGGEYEIKWSTKKQSRNPIHQKEEAALFVPLKNSPLHYIPKKISSTRETKSFLNAAIG